jgi:ribosomal protein S27AE
MNLSEALLRVRDYGATIRRRGWLDQNHYLSLDFNGNDQVFSTEDIFASDWETVEDHKPCPFCGSESTVLEHHVDRCRVRCAHCGASVAGSNIGGEALAWAEWDRRV